MKLAEKDKTFLDNLKKLMESKDLWVELRPNRPGYMVLKGTYGEEIHRTFQMTWQEVRWRFQRLFSHVYVEAFESIMMIEKTFGTELREYVLRIGRERYEMRRDILKSAFRDASIR